MNHKKDELEQHLIHSLKAQRQELRRSIILNPVESLPRYLHREESTDFIQGLYVTDKVRTQAERKDSKILFAGREAAIADMQLIYTSWAKRLGAKEVSMRLLSGLHAHIVVFMGLGKPGDKVLLLPETAGGHFSTAGILERLGYEVISATSDAQAMAVDAPETLKTIKKEDPEFIFIDRSEGLIYEDFERIIAQSDAYCVFDASQYLPAIMSGAYRNPFRMGFDLVISTLHKSYPGPQKALVATATESPRWVQLKKSMSSFVSSTHVKNTYLAQIETLGETELRSYVSKKLKTATDLESALLAMGVPVVERQGSGMPTHHLWVQLGSKDRAFRFFSDLEKCRILTNYRLLPYSLGYGLRLGTGAATLMGIEPGQVRDLADCISQIYSKGATEAVANRVERMATEARAKAIVNI